MCVCVGLRVCVFPKIAFIEQYAINHKQQLSTIVHYSLTMITMNHYQSIVINSTITVVDVLQPLVFHLTTINGNQFTVTYRDLSTAASTPAVPGFGYPRTEAGVS